MNLLKKIKQKIHLVVGVFVLAVFIGFAIYSFFIKGFHVKKSTFSKLPGWSQANLQKSLAAWQQSCQRIMSFPHKMNVGSSTIKLKAGNWRPVCQAALSLKNPTNNQIKDYFQNWFQPWQIKFGSHTHGIFTGYYLYSLQGRLKKQLGFTVPVYAMPSDAVMIYPHQFDHSQKHTKWVGKVMNNRVRPYPMLKRAEINRHGLAEAKVLAWVPSRVDRLFLMIQGSGIVHLPNDKSLLLSYAGENGYKNTLIGHFFIKENLIPRSQLSMDSIKAWIKAHPRRGRELMNKNPAFVFFKTSRHGSVVGTEGVPLTGGTSLAVDPHYMPLGAPIWLNTTFPASKQSLQRLMVAQDTGGAISGAIRGDVYWGDGDIARKRASVMRQTGQYWVLMPKGWSPH